MKGWGWLTGHDYSVGFVRRVLLKTILLFLVLNLIFALVNPLPLIGQLSVYNRLVPGRVRLPYGENSEAAYNLSPNTLTALFSAHRIATPEAPDKFRVLLIGDSGVWGILLRPDETLAASLNAADLTLPDGGPVEVYNLGYPILSLTKDLLILDHALRYEPDLIVWLVTLESFAYDTQLDSPLVQANADRIRELITEYSLPLDPNDPRLHDPTFFERTIVGQRRELADWLRVQLYGFAWAATGIDQYYPLTYDLRAEDYPPDVGWHNFDEPGPLTVDDIALDVLSAGIERAGSTPVLLVNEPMFISSGENSDLRYNFFYPQWAYDEYRDLLAETAAANDWPLLDLWDAIPPHEFTDSPVHLTPAGSRQLAELIAPTLLELAQR